MSSYIAGIRNGVFLVLSIFLLSKTSLAQKSQLFPYPNDTFLKNVSEQGSHLEFKVDVLVPPTVEKVLISEKKDVKTTDYQSQEKDCTYTKTSRLTCHLLVKYSEIRRRLKSGTMFPIIRTEDKNQEGILISLGSNSSSTRDNIWVQCVKSETSEDTCQTPEPSISIGNFSLDYLDFANGTPNKSFLSFWRTEEIITKQ